MSKNTSKQEHKQPKHQPARTTAFIFVKTDPSILSICFVQKTQALCILLYERI